MRALPILFLKGIGSVASCLPLFGPDEGSILEFFELMSVWAETAHSQLPTPRGYWQRLISGPKRTWDPQSREQRELLSICLGASWFPGTSLWLGGTPSPIGRVAGSGLSSAWVVFEPPPLPATGGVGPVIWI